jgi:hypothetical protein
MESARRARTRGITMKRFQAAITVSVATLFLTASSVQAHHEEFEVITDVISHEDTQDIHVWAPMAGAGDRRPFPVVYAIAGSGGYGSDWDVIGSALAARGAVVFATDYHQDDIKIGRFDRIIRDVECGYRYVREVAADYGGDLEQPVVGLGHSLGAEMALGGALDDVSMVPGGTYDECFSGVERADITVGLGGCYYEAEGQTYTLESKGYGTGGGDVSMVFIAGEDDETCEAWQSVQAAKDYAEAGFDTTYVEVPGTSHLELIGHDIIDDEFVTLPDEEAALTVAYAILEAIYSYPGS